MTHGPQWILWAGTVDITGPLEPRIAAAVANGYTCVSMSPLDIARAEDQGVSAAEVGKRIRDAGLSIIMDPVMNWYGGIPAATSRFGMFSTRDSLRMCVDLQVASLSLIAQREGDVPLDAMVEPFAQVCAQAADFGARVHLEFIPMTEIPDLASAWAIVDRAAAPNGGILLDTWHFFRGNPDLGLLAALPGESIMAVQVDDAHEHVRGSLWDDTKERLLPGDGSFDLDSVMAVLHEIGGLTWVGPEVISAHMSSLEPNEAARIAGERVRELVARTA